MDSIQILLEGVNMPLVTAFLLGILTSLSPCPLATNITAIGYISKSIDNQHRVFWSGVLYTLGRVIAYTTLGFILILILREGASMFAIQKTISRYGEIFIAPTLILIGLFMLFGSRINLPKFGFNGGHTSSNRRGAWGALWLGVLFSLAFCPTSGVFYFGMLIPMSAAESGGYLLPAIFALATGLPVLIVAWILAYSVASFGRFYNRIVLFQKWFSSVVALLFIAVGVYYGVIYYL